ncbi:Facilitated trehalose transporter Tret1 [Chamberlinius hualienensis]
MMDEPANFQKMNITESISKKKSTFCNSRLYFATLVISISGLNTGTILSFPSPAIVKMNTEPNEFRVSLEEQSLIVSTAFVGSFIGGLIQRPFTEGLGRKLTLMLAFIPLMIGWLTILTSQNVWMVYIGRLFTGLIYGLYSSCPSIYVAEISPTNLRGNMTFIYTLMSSFGILWTYVIGGFFSWRWLIVSYLVVNVIMVIGLYVVPESPRWLLLKGYKEAAIDSLRWYRGHEDVQQEYDEIESNIKESSSEPDVAWKEMLKREHYRPLLLMMCVFFINRWSGVVVLDSYSVTIFESSGINLDPYVATMIIGVIELVGEIIMYPVIGLVGRKKLLIVSGIGICISLTILATSYKLSSDYTLFAQTYCSWLPITALSVYFISCDIGWFSIPFVLLGEILPLRIRGFAGGIIISFTSVLTGLTTLLFGIFVKIIGEFGAFLIFGSCAFLGVFFVIFFLPETKDKSLEEIEKEFRN